MKNLLCIILGLSLLAVPACFFTGCTTTSTGQKVPDPVLLKAVSQEAAAVGTTLYLANNPSERDNFELALLSLKGLLAAGGGTVGDLQTALALLPVKELEGDSGSVIISSAAVLIRTAGSQVVALDKREIWNSYVKPVAEGLAAGLETALK